MYSVTFNFEQQGRKPVTLRNVEEGQTLLELAVQNNIHLPHNCGGMCTCTTCHLYIQKGMDHIQKMQIREKDFIRKAIRPQGNSRLGCQSLLLQGKGEIEVIVPVLEL